MLHVVGMWGIFLFFPAGVFLFFVFRRPPCAPKGFAGNASFWGCFGAWFVIGVVKDGCFVGRVRSPHGKNDGATVVYDAWVSDSGCIGSWFFWDFFVLLEKKLLIYIFTIFLFFVFNDIKKKKKEYKEILHRGFREI